VASLTIPERPPDLTPEWLTAALSPGRPPARVTEARWERVGQDYGFTGLVGRIHLSYERDGHGWPTSCIAKLPLARDDNTSAYRKRQERDPLLVDRYYERCRREARFYREIPVSCAPGLYYEATDDTSRRVILLLEDVAGGRQGDVLHGCSVDDAAAVFEELAPLHAAWWGRKDLSRRFPPARTDDPQARQHRYASLLPDFLSNYDRKLPRDVRNMADRLGTRLASVVAALDARPQTLIHGDLHLDNLIFDADRKDASVVVLDWQTVSAGSPARDVAMFLFQSLDMSDRRAAEDELFDRYLNGLVEHGVRGYSLDDLRLDCRFALLVMLAGSVVWLTALKRDELTTRERALQDAVFGDERLVAALRDHDAGALLRDV
jgi:aminoglycoside phosphotransferase (APT) family kinase protein